MMLSKAWAYGNRQSAARAAVRSTGTQFRDEEEDFASGASRRDRFRIVHRKTRLRDLDDQVHRGKPRKAAAEAADAGATVAEPEAVFGWQGGALPRSTRTRPTVSAWRDAD
jgi:hypothetical protein